MILEAQKGLLSARDWDNIEKLVSCLTEVQVQLTFPLEDILDTLRAGLHALKAF